MPIHIQYSSIDYGRKDVTDTMCGNIFLNILSKKINRENYSDSELQQYLMPRIVEFIKDFGNKCEILHRSLFTMKSVMEILHYIKSYRLLIKFNEQNLKHHMTAHTELKKISQFWITNRPRLTYQDRAITEKWDKIMLEIMKCLPKYLKYLKTPKTFRALYKI